MMRKRVSGKTCEFERKIMSVLDEMGRDSGLVYLACPYTHDEPMVMLDRFESVTRLTAMLCERDVLVYSPVTHFHHVVTLTNLPPDFAGIWKRVCIHMLRKSDSLAVLMSDGWDVSKGVRQEIKIATLLGMNIYYINSKDVKNGSPQQASW